MNIQRRTAPMDRIEVRQEGDGAATIVGHAAVFNSFSEEMWGFVERIKPGAFSRALSEGQDVRALVGHNDEKVLGRTKSGTLTLREDATGLAIENRLPDTTYAADLIESIKRGDIDQMSFAFRAKEVLFIEGAGPDGLDVRELIDVDLFDVSPVTYPAYPQTDVSLRSQGPDEEARAAYEAWKAERRGVEYVQVMAALAPFQARQARAEAGIL